MAPDYPEIRHAHPHVLTPDRRRPQRPHPYPPGSKLPSLRELADLHSVSVSTIQRALELTRDRGLTVGRAGAGVYVTEGLG
ncbi:regulatory protein, gntR family [Micromonospora matsumotoense]|uniref:Regulatory protein, gntR family n=1 Tax=Micromonospora matsumotoense TaxID=121616 RepID=A0A1C5ACE0_9ACTN|nr:regulatory protein, gntR family [Micromonospora matsumotoense]